jgi:hypothetical protein
MSHVRSISFDSLESRQLLSKAHVVAAHAKPAVAATLLVLNGTLTVDNKAASTTMNEDGSTTTSIPVSGQLSALGQVRGTWEESSDQYGDYEGPDTIQLRGSKGSIVIAFSDASHLPISHPGRGSVSYQHPQLLFSGTRAYSRTTEGGLITLTTNPARNSIETMTLTTTSRGVD